MSKPTLICLLFCLAPALIADALPKVVILATGGTIASRHDSSKGGYIPAISGEDLVAAAPAIRGFANIQVEQISNISSSDMTPAIWLRLARRANEVLSNKEIAGIVITHGTNTLEETAYFLDLTIKSTKPVVLVGAQRPASDADADGPRNLLDAVRVAANAESVNKGVLVVMNGQINAARDVTKTHTSQVETFRSLEFGQLGVVDESAVRFYRNPVRRQSFDLGMVMELPRVEIVMAYAGADGLMVRSASKTGVVKGFVIAGLGLGGVSSSMYDAIKEVRGQGLPVVVGTRVPMGRVFALSATKGSPLELQRIGCVFGDNLSPQKARVLLMLSLVETQDSALLQKLFYY